MQKHWIGLTSKILTVGKIHKFAVLCAIEPGADLRASGLWIGNWFFGVVHWRKGKH